MNCENCNGGMILSKVQKYHYVESGLENVFLDNINVYCCGDCGVKIPAIPKILTLHSTIGLAIVCKKNLLTGAEMQFLRKNLRMKSQNWADILRTDKSVYSRWENGQKISLQADLLIRYAYLRSLEEKVGRYLKTKIVEDLAKPETERLAIIIDAEQIEEFSFLPFETAFRLSAAEAKSADLFIDLDESNIFLSELETPLSPESMNVYEFERPPARAVIQELALAA